MCINLLYVALAMAICIGPFMWISTKIGNWLSKFDAKC